MRKLSLLGIIILILICHSLDAATVYVDINNVGQEDGTERQPFNTIQEGIDQARDGDTVLVNDGRYVDRGNINLSFEGKAITVKSANGPGATIIDCENLDDTKGFIFNKDETTSSVLDGFTITNGNASSFDGGAIFCSSSPLITNCAIIGNTANNNGGGGIIFDGSSAVITNSIIAGNTANYGGGIACISGAEPTITNCTITENQAFGGEGGGMAFFSLGGKPPVITNTIIWGNIGATPEVHLGTDNAVISITFSDVHGGKEEFGGDEAAIADSTYRNNINADPLFVDPINVDFRLANGSPCIDAGTANGAPDIDIEGNRRPFGAAPDIGAFENTDVQIVDDGIIYVDATNQGEEDGSETKPFNTIQEGIDAAEGGNTVQVAAGTYNGPIEFKDGIALRGAGREVTIIIAEEGESVIDVTDVGAGQIDGFTIDAREIIENTIALDRAVVEITNNIITGAESSGIFAQSSAPTITGNELVNNKNAGIHLDRSDAIVMGNVIKENGFAGIICEVRANATITDNEITLNGSHGIALSQFSEPKIQNNQIVNNGEKGIHAERASGMIEDNFILQNSIGIGGSAADMTIHKNTIVENRGDGIQIDRSNPIITQNEIRGNQGHAILLVNSSGGAINDNVMSENSDHGVFISQASPTLEGNTVTDNAGDGVYCAGGSNPTIVNNTLSFNRANGIGVNRDENGEAGATIRGNQIIGNTIYGISVLSTDHGSVVITGNEISENINSGVSLLDDGEIVTASAQIVSNRIINNGSSGIENHRGNAYIRGNLITGNFDNGVWMKNEETIPNLGTAIELGNNIIHGNRGSAQLWNETPHDIQAVGNFWGNGTEADGPRDLIGNGGGGNVLFSPWLRLEPRTPEISGEIPSPIETLIAIPDRNLRRALEEALGKNSDEEIIAEDLVAATNFEAHGRNISDLTGLEYAASLTTLSLEDNQIEDLRPLANLVNLQQLHLSGNPITDIQPIENLTNLAGLELGNNPITDFSPLANLTNLTSLELWGNPQIADIDFVANLTNLAHLNLSGNDRISDIDPLANLTNLMVLLLNNNQISDIDPLANLTNLMVLLLNNNQISDINPLANLTDLEGVDWIDINLNLSNNQINDLQPLVDNPGLDADDRVNVQGNPLSSTSLNTHIPALQARGVNVLFDAVDVVGPVANIEVSLSTESLTVGSGETAEITITVTDESGNPVTDETITLTISPQNGSVTETATHQGNGVYKGVYTAGDTQAEDIFIEVETSNGIQNNATLKLTEAVLTQISFGSQLPSLVFAGGIIPISLVGTDDKGNTVEVPSNQIIWGFSGDAIGTIDADSLQFTAKFVGKAKIIATLKSNATITAQSNEITVIAGATAVVKVESSTLNLTTGSGETAELTITVTDEFGNSVTNETITLTHAPATGNLPKIATNQGDGTYIATYTALGETAEDIFIEAETSNAVKDSISITLVEKDAEPPLVITLDKTSLSLGTVTVGESQQETLAITNPNASDLVVSAITSSRGEFTISPTSFTLNPGSTQTVTVSFKPIIAGAVSAALTIASNATTKTIAMSGTGVQQTLAITLDKTSFSFGTVKVGESKQETLIITNPNASDVVVSAITSTRGEFTISPTSFTLPPSSSQAVSITFVPTLAGVISAILTIASNADAQTVAVSGTGEQQTLTITIDKTSLSFGIVKVGESKQETLTITNPNASDLVVSAITSSRGEFTVSPGSFTLNPGSTQTITVTFKPATAGAISATVTLASNADAQTVAVSGTGEPQTLTITIDRTSLSFGTVKVGESKQETLTITNPNASDVVVSAITWTRAEFTVSPVSFTLNPGSSQTITTTFKPATAGTISTLLTITSNAATRIIFVFGTGETIQPIFGTLTAVSFATAPPQMIAGGTFQFSIIGTNDAGQTETVASGDVVWEVSGGVGTVTDSGELTVTTVGKGVVKVTLKANATLIAETAEITVIVAQADKVQSSMTPNSLTAGSGETATATITVTDEFENPVTGLIITMTATDGNISSTATEAGNGIYNATYTAGTTVGNVEIRATTPNGKIGTATLTLKEKATTETPTFELTTRDEVMSVDAGEETVSYRLRLDGKNGFSDTIELFASELPPNVTAKIDPKTITLSEAEPIDISDLTLTLPADLVGNDYSFTVFARSEDGQSKVLTLTLKVGSAERVSTRLTLTVQPATVAFMETLNLSGELVPLTNTPVEIGNAKVTITFIAPSEREHTFETTTDENGNYKLATPFLPDEVGNWTVVSKFAGNDELKLTERESTFTVTKGDSKITFSSGETGALGTTIEIVGQLVPALDDEEIALKVLRPDGAASQITNITTETLGVFRYSLELDLAGDWEFTATWSGNTQYEDETQKLVVSVTKEIGKAILVLGGGDRNDNPAWESFNGVAEYVHNILIKREFNDEDDIWFLSPDPTRTSGADTQTTQSNLQLAITNWASSRVNRQVPLFLYFLSHNLEDQFLLEKRGNSETHLSASQLAGWLDELPDDTQVTIIIEACHSGNFITAPLIRKNRTIIVSASADKQAKITPSLSSFSKIFFDQINLNKTIAEAFRFTQAKMLVLRTHRSQQPQMDANANGQANQPQDFAVVSSRYIPENIVSLADPPELIKITEATTLGEGISSLRIETELLGVAINRVFATVIPPDFNPDQRFDDWNALAFDEFDLANVGEGKYAATYANFTQPGEYTILVNASNPDGSAEPVQTTITVPGGVASATPWDVDGSGVVDIFDLVIVGNNFGKSGSGDVDGNGLVNIFDLVLVSQHFGERN